MKQDPFSIRLLQTQDYPAAVTVCASAMLDNPVHAKVFGQRRELRKRRLLRFFPRMLAYVGRKGELYGAFSNNELIGVVGMIPPGQCQPGLLDMLRLLPGILFSNSPPGLLRTAYWLLRWARLDPDLPHWHMGPLSVAPEWQGKGAGHLLMNHAMERGKDDNLYLETDTIENVRLYESIGFEPLRSVEIMGTRSWLMLKPASVTQPDAPMDI